MSSWKLHTDCALLRHDHCNQIISSSSADCSETRMQPRERTDGRLANRQRPVAYSVRVLLAVARIPEEHSMSAGLSPQHVNSSSTDLQRSRGARRSEEHTSELQSHHDLVCRLLLEKKKAR